jgi:CheY-like chemotaxis protein
LGFAVAYAEAMSSSPSERRAKPDRRQAVRGGRRPYDEPGVTPLVLVVGNGDAPQRDAETILGKLKCAVAMASDANDALRVLESLHPDLIVTRPDAAPDLRGAGIRIVEYEGDVADGPELVDRVLAALRKNR